MKYKKAEFVDIVSQIIMNGDNEDMSYEEIAIVIWDVIIDKK